MKKEKEKRVTKCNQISSNRQTAESRTDQTNNSAVEGLSSGRAAFGMTLGAESAVLALRAHAKWRVRAETIPKSTTERTA
jgi:hypothetical protein